MEYGEGDTMGVTYASAVIRNAAEPERSWEGVFLVDTGATDSLAPRQHLEAIGMKPRGRRTYEMADGREIAMDITTAEVEILGEIVGTTIVYGETDNEPLLGVTVLQSAGIAIDPCSESLYKRPSIRL